MKCEHCQRSHNGKYGSGRFCNKICARAFSTSAKREEINDKVSAKLTGRKTGYNGYANLSKKEKLARSLALAETHRLKRVERHKGKFESLSYEDRRYILLESQDYKCKICRINEWQGLPIALHYDHKNGDSQDNRRTNSRMICPNCHSQTPTYCGKNKQNKTVTDEEMAKALHSHKTIRQALTSLGMAAKGGNYVRAKRIAAQTM